MKAIISVSDKVGVVEFVRELVNLGFEIYSTGGTLKVLESNHIKVKSVSEITKFPEILDGRVKTLHPYIHGGILADKQNPAHIDTCNEHGIALFDLVVVNLYPFKEVTKKEDCSFKDAIENIDIGGPTMIRAAAKNFQSMGVVVSPKQYDKVLAELSASKGKLSEELRLELATEAFATISDYDIAISNYFKAKNNSDAFPGLIQLNLDKEADLRYGENPHQKAALYTITNADSDTNIKQLHGKELSYNNYLDIEAAISIVSDLSLPGAAVIKHSNPCGAAVGETVWDAYKKAYEADPVSAFGSIVGFNRQIGKKSAEELSKTFIEVIVAPKFDDEALEILSKKANLRLIEVSSMDCLKSNYYFRYIGNKFLVQQPDHYNVKEDDLTIITKKEPSTKEVNDLIFANSLVKHVKSNAILIAKDGQTIGIGAGQMSRVDSVEIALKKAGDNAKGAVMASDAFFPFKDSVELASKYGIAAIIQPGGSKRDQESIDACDEHGISMCFTGVRHFKH